QEKSHVQSSDRTGGAAHFTFQLRSGQPLQAGQGAQLVEQRKDQPGMEQVVLNLMTTPDERSPGLVRPCGVRHGEWTMVAMLDSPRSSIGRKHREDGRYCAGLGRSAAR